MTAGSNKGLAIPARFHQESAFMKSLHTFITILVVIMVMMAGFLFTLYNTQPVTVWAGTELPAWPLGIWILGAFIAGGFTGLLLGAGLLRRLLAGIRARRERSRLIQQDMEIDSLKSQLRQLQHRK
jgi:uncharacterized integral membrane protein